MDSYRTFGHRHVFEILSSSVYQYLSYNIKEPLNAKKIPKRIMMLPISKFQSIAMAIYLSFFAFFFHPTDK